MGSRPKEFSVFVNNLPERLDQFGLKGIFLKAGKVCGTYISNRRGRSIQGRFGFVRFRFLEDAKRSIQTFHGAVIRGNRLSVAWAKPKRRWLRKQDVVMGRELRTDQSGLGWGEKLGTHEGVLVRFNDESQPYKMRLEGQRNEEFEEWLGRSLVCTSEEPRDLATLSSAICDGFGQCSKICALSSFKFILAFPTVEAMEDAFSHQEELQQWFVDVKKWGVEDCCDTRKVWLDIIGVPPHGWKWENFKQIAELWGKFICLGKSSTSTDSFEVMRVLIATEHLRRIESEVLLTVGSCGYRVRIKEAETLCQMLHKALHNSSFKSVDANSDVPGFEDIDDLLSNRKEVEDANSDVPGFDDIDDLLSNRKEVEVVEETPTSRLNSNSNSNLNSKYGKDFESPRGNVSGPHEASGSRTKTVSLSQNGYSVELFKVGQLLRKETIGELHEESARVSTQPPGFEAVAVNPDPLLPHSKPIGVDGSTQGIGVDSSSQSTINAPPGFEGVHNTQSKSQKRMEPKQKRVDKGPASNKSKKPTLKAVSVSTNSTPESLKRIARESLEIGRILGLRVIANEPGAISRITKSLKTRKAQGKNHK